MRGQPFLLELNFVFFVDHEKKLERKLETLLKTKRDLVIRPIDSKYESMTIFYGWNTFFSLKKRQEQACCNL